jgi:hypothetical protein
VGDRGGEFSGYIGFIRQFFNRPYRVAKVYGKGTGGVSHTPRKTWSQETGDLLNQGIGGEEGIIFAGQFLDKLLVLVQLLQVIGGHGINAVVLGTIDIVLITQDAIFQPSVTRFLLPSGILLFNGLNAPEAHSRAGHSVKLDGTRETLVTLGIVVLHDDLEFDGLEEVPLLLILRVVEELLDILAHTGYSVC